MDRNAFETAARDDGYVVGESALKPGTDTPDHTHAFDARVMVLGGEIALTMGGERRVYAPGE